MQLRGDQTVLILFSLMNILTFGCCSQETLPCNFDKIQSKTLAQKTNVKYVKPKGGHGPKRAVESAEDVYEPIRIGVFIHDLDDYEDTTEVQRLEKVSRSAMSIIKKLFSVIPVQGPLLISRSEDACFTRHFSGPYQGKCSALSNSYMGEKCLDDFLIPDDHLGGFWVWDDMAVMTEQPTMVFSNGSGIADTDTVLYMKKQHTQQCTRSPDIVAYAAYCKVDQSNRPIVGVVNFCPNHLRDGVYDEDKFILLTVHEIFHILGFSCSLFDQFRDCSFTDSNTDCPRRDLVTSVDSHNQYRLITPEVLKESERLLNCSDSEYTGGPLENGAAGSCLFSSHWETRFMTGSIMAPTIGKPHQTFVDSLTLAVFEDSGWYKVNYEYAENLPWAANQGCTYGLTEVCEGHETDRFCNTSSSGCHYLHHDKAMCSSNIFLDQCSAYLADSMGQCSVESTTNIPTIDGEVYHPDSRCYVSNLTPQGMEPCTQEGRCYLTRCHHSEQEYQLKVGNGSWVTCREQTSVMISGYDGVVMCPPYETICANRTSILDLIDPYVPTTASTSMDITTMRSITSPVIHDLCIGMTFGELGYDQVGEEEVLFTEKVRDTVCDTTNLMKDRVIQFDIVQQEMIVYVTFDIISGDEDMAMDSPVVSAEEAYQELEMAVANMMFQVPHMGQMYAATDIRIIARNTSPPSSTSSAPSTVFIKIKSNSKVGLAAGIVVGGIILILVIAYIVCKKNIPNAVTPDPDAGDEAIPNTPRSHALYIVKEAEMRNSISFR